MTNKQLVARTLIKLLVLTVFIMIGSLIVQYKLGKEQLQPKSFQNQVQLAFSNLTILLSDSQRPTKASNIRLRLLDQSPQSSSSQKKNWKDLVSLTVAIVVVACLSIGLCVIVIIVYIIRKDRQNTQKQQKSQKNYRIIFPILPTTMFINSYEHSWVDQCAICLQELKIPNDKDDDRTYPFPSSTESSKRSQIKVQEISSINEIILKGEGSKVDPIRKFQPINFQIQNEYERPEDSSNFTGCIKKQDEIYEQNVQLTYCGHLLHQKCLDQWIDKNFSCPICREEFSLENLEKFQKLLGFKLFVILEDLDKNKSGLTSHKIFDLSRLEQNCQQSRTERLQITEQAKMQNLQNFEKILFKNNRINSLSSRKQLQENLGSEATSHILKEQQNDQIILKKSRKSLRRSSRRQIHHFSFEEY